MNLSNNDILFRCQYDILNGEPSLETVKLVRNFIVDYYQNKGKEVNFNFSHDNWKGVIAWAKVFSPELLKRIPIFGHHSLRPDNFFLFLYARYKYVGIFFIWIYLLFQVFDAIRMRKDARGIPHTSGLLLNFFVIGTFGFELTGRFIDYRVEKTFEEGWDSVFKIYYVQDNNRYVLEKYLEVNA